MGALPADDTGPTRTVRNRVKIRTRFAGIYELVVADGRQHDARYLDLASTSWCVEQTWTHVDAPREALRLARE